jgi:hypothetical protein
MRLDLVFAAAMFRNDWRNDFQGALDLIERTLAEANADVERQPETIEGEAAAILEAMGQRLRDWSEQVRNGQ